MEKIIYTSFSLFLLLCLTSCNSRETSKEIKPGTYQMEGSDSQIVLNPNKTITIHNYDLSELEKKSYEDFLIAKEQKNLSEGETLSKEKEQKIRDDIDLTSQFIDKENSYHEETEDGYIGIYVPVKNCDLYFYAQFCPSDNTVTFDNKIFKLTN